MFCRCRYSPIINHNVNPFFFQTVADCCRVLQSVWPLQMFCYDKSQRDPSFVQSVAACCRVFQSVAACCRAFYRCRYFSIFNDICAKETCVRRTRDLCHTQKRRKRDVCHVCRKDGCRKSLFYIHDKRLF